MTSVLDPAPAVGVGRPGEPTGGEAARVESQSRQRRWQPSAATKLLGALGFLLVVALTSPTIWLAFIGYAALLAVALSHSRVPLKLIARRSVVVVPFVLFALALPFFGRPPSVDVLGLSLSEQGLWAAFGIITKASIGVVVAVLLGSTTRTTDLLDGLRVLRVPAILVDIAGFMARYSVLVGQEWHRMSLARQARGFTATGVRGWPTLARSLGVLFIRSYERAERVHTAMLARGYTGTMPQQPGNGRTGLQWIAVLPGMAATVILVPSLLLMS